MVNMSEPVYFRIVGEKKTLFFFLEQSLFELYITAYFDRPYVPTFCDNDFYHLEVWIG